jgi:NDP-sugar pyrophosphorylase family protein
MKAALVILAAGMGSRYGGVKQIEGVGPNGEILMEYSIFDAVRAGFTKIVFIITKEIHEGIHELFDARLRSRGIEVEYAIQDYSSLPSFYKIPAERKKPYGTAHALLCAKKAVNEPFAVINADDYYGNEAYATLYKELVTMPAAGRAAMVGFKLKNTVSKHGTVTRGICTAENGFLKSITETYKITVFPDETIRDIEKNPEGTLLDPDALVSMNYWGFSPSIFAEAENYLNRFLRQISEDDLKSECLLPAFVDEQIKEGKLAVKMLGSDSVWFGMTNREDRPSVASGLKSLHENGTYPAKLW